MNATKETPIFEYNIWSTLQSLSPRYDRSLDEIRKMVPYKIFIRIRKPFEQFEYTVDLLGSPGEQNTQQQNIKTLKKKPNKKSIKEIS